MRALAAISRVRVLAAAAALALGAPALRAQEPTMPSTLRYGTGLLDVPVSSVLPHLQVRGTYSGMFLSLDRRVSVDATGTETVVEEGRSSFSADAAVSVGLFDRGEVGLTLHSFGSREAGGDVWGLFGRYRLLQPVDQGLGLAVGARWLTSPQFGDGVARDPGRLGFPDARLRERWEGGEEVMGTTFTPYAVTTAYLRGWDAGPIPEHDLTFSLGWGGGMFRNGPDAAFYGGGSNGWFMGTSAHFLLRPGSTLELLADHNGFDLNVGVQVDVEGFRAGVHWLGANHSRPTGGYASEYRAPKLGVVLSASLCAGRPRLRCRPRLMERVEPDTIFIPPPPPDTVVIAGGPPEPEGEPATVCLSTGQNAPVRITEAGDTLVGPSGVPIDALRPVVDFAGTYASGAGWFERGDAIIFEDGRFVKSPESFPIDCGEIVRVGVYQGVAVFADRVALRPFDVLFVPVRVGVWHRYRRED